MVDGLGFVLDIDLGLVLDIDLGFVLDTGLELVLDIDLGFVLDIDPGSAPDTGLETALDTGLGFGRGPDKCQESDQDSLHRYRYRLTECTVACAHLQRKTFKEVKRETDAQELEKQSFVSAWQHSPVSRHIVLMRTNVINLLNRVPEYDSLTFFVLHRTKCK